MMNGVDPRKELRAIVPEGALGASYTLADQL